MITPSVDKQTTVERKLRWPKLVIVAACVYSCWLMWLAYVAWVNIQAGNQ